MMVAGKMKRAVIVFTYVALFYTTHGRNCPKKCGEKDEPICGTDGNTYNNPCLLDLSACEQNKKILMVHRGRCNPCNTHECTAPPNSRCVVDDNGLPECVCTFRCYPFKREVCGSDGQTYRNKCEMQKSSCNENVRITIANAGPCGRRGACSRVKCPGTSICKIIRGRTRCVSRKRCKLHCPRIYKPVCGTNQKTFSNQCTLERLMCIKHLDIVVSYKGRCRAVRGACRRKKCPKGMYCQLKTRQPRCVRACRRFCPRVYQPVCADDGRTYSSNCEREREACETNTKIKVVIPGRCIDSKFGCERISCRPHHICKNIFGSPKCYRRVCKRWCARIYRPVCASDGKTYPNECEMHMQSCRNRKIVRKLRNGRCGRSVGCQLLSCVLDKKPYSYCKLINKEPSCVCKDKCPTYKQPVCGSDKKTYDTRCHLEMISCKTEVRITVAYDGQCRETCETKDCSSKHYSVCQTQGDKAFCVCPSNCNLDRNQVCGSDGVTYINQCLMKRYSCYNNKLVTLKHMGNCSIGSCVTKNCTRMPYSTCNIVNKQPTCICPTFCAKIFKPVCGSDNRTYPDACIMKKIACENGTMITIKANRKCRESSPYKKEDAGPETCGQKNCSGLPYMTCKMINNKPTCTCPTSCTKIFKPVCGSDDKTYPNSCIMEKTSCENEKMIITKANGKCKENVSLQTTKKPETCDQNNCSSLPYMICEMINNQPTCTCQTYCTRRLKPVCGSDGKTYPNKCVLEKISCENNVTIAIKGNGKCREIKTCAQKNCTGLPYSVCKVINNQPTCVCPTFCAKVVNPLCGSDDTTYPNVCIMKRISCMNNVLIVIKSNGKCKGEDKHK